MPQECVSKNSDRTPLVSVLLLSYNHECFLEQSIQSVLNQEHGFDLELLICDDASSDCSVKILQNYSEHPEVRLELNKKNVGLAKNLAAGLSQCQGKYVAMIEGDDFWTDNTKLIKQINYMEVNRDCVLSCHAIDMVDRDGVRIKSVLADEDEVKIYSLDDLVAGNFIRNCSVIYRRIPHLEIPEWFYSLPTCDFPLHVFHSLTGHIAQLPMNMAAYRLHSDSLYSSRGKIHDFKFRETFYPILSDYLGSKYQTVCNRQYYSSLYSQLVHYLENQEYSLARQALYKLIGFKNFCARKEFFSKGLIRYFLARMRDII